MRAWPSFSSPPQPAHFPSRPDPAAVVDVKSAVMAGAADADVAAEAGVAAEVDVVADVAENRGMYKFNRRTSYEGPSM